MSNLNETMVNILDEMFPEIITNPLAINKGKINQYFKDLEYHKANIQTVNERETNLKGYKKAFELSVKILPLINVDSIKLPVNIKILTEEANIGMVSLLSNSPKQIVKNIKYSGRTLTMYETAETYSAIFQCAYLEAEQTILNRQAEQIKSNPSIKLKSNVQRVSVYDMITSNGSIYDCAEQLGLMPIQVIELRKVSLYEFEQEETKPYIKAKIIR
jgi:hypothetical protein